MAIGINFSTKVITVNQADCTLVSGTFYRLPTKTVFKAQVDALMDNEDYIWMDDPIDHNTDYTVAGVTYAPKIEVVNGYTVEFSPNSAWSVELNESNNNLWDVGSGVLVQNQVQVIPTNAAGLQIVTAGSGVTAQDKIDIAALSATDVMGEIMEGSITFGEMIRTMSAVQWGDMTPLADGVYEFKSIDGLKVRVRGTVAADGTRTLQLMDGL